MRSNIHTSRLRQTVEINMTPLMDLTFTLLIVFIITVPVLNYSTDVKLPELTTKDKIEDMPEALFLELDDQGICKIDGMPVPVATLTEKLVEYHRNAGKNKAFISADESRPYQDVIALLRCAKNAGMETALMTKAEKASAK